MANTFPIFRLPFLALKEALKSLTPFELLDFAQCSKKCSRIIKLVAMLIIKLDLRLKLIEINDKISIKTFERNGENVTSTRNIGYHTVPVAYGSNPRNVYTFWDDRVFGTSEVFKHFLNTFSCRVDHIYTCQNVPRETYLSCVKALPKLHCKSLAVEADSLLDEDVSWILDNVSVIDYYSLRQKFSEGFSYNGKPFEAQWVMICESNWFTVDHFDRLMKNCVYVTLNDSVWTNEDVRELIRKWRAGQYPNLQNLTVRSSNFDVDLKKDGLDALADDFLDLGTIYNDVSIEQDNGSVIHVRYDTEVKRIHLYTPRGRFAGWYMNANS